MDAEEYGELKRMVKELHSAVVGNGKPGLVTEWQAHKVDHAKIDGVVLLIKWISGVVGLPTLASVAWMIIERLRSG